MTKLRVHELAKELGMENKDLMEILCRRRMWRCQII
ncbi:MAG: translation initiation factor IF-2 N-terminal domain-containing protein [Mediterraneibacter gnavus]